MTFNRLEIGELVTLRQGFAINKKTNYHISEKSTNLPLLRIGDMKDGAFKVFVRDTIPDKFIAKKVMLFIQERDKSEQYLEGN